MWKHACGGWRMWSVWPMTLHLEGFYFKRLYNWNTKRLRQGLILDWILLHTAGAKGKCGMVVCLELQWAVGLGVACPACVPPIWVTDLHLGDVSQKSEFASCWVWSQKIQLSQRSGEESILLVASKENAGDLSQSSVSPDSKMGGKFKLRKHAYLWRAWSVDRVQALVDFSQEGQKRSTSLSLKFHLIYILLFP